MFQSGFLQLKHFAFCFANLYVQFCNFLLRYILVEGFCAAPDERCLWAKYIFS